MGGINGGGRFIQIHIAATKSLATLTCSDYQYLDSLLILRGGAPPPPRIFVSLEVFLFWFVDMMNDQFQFHFYVE